VPTPHDRSALQPRASRRRAPSPCRPAGLAEGESVIKYKSSLNVLKDTYDHSCCLARSDEYNHLLADSPGLGWTRTFVCRPDLAPADCANPAAAPHMGAVIPGLGHIVALHHRASTSCHIQLRIRVPLFLKRWCDRTLGGVPDSQARSRATALRARRRRRCALAHYYTPRVWSCWVRPREKDWDFLKPSFLKAFPITTPNASCAC
jgi:hypothetical protein